MDPKRVTARVGSINQFAGGSIVSVSAINIHPSYGNFLHDIAVLTLSEPLTLTGSVAKIAFDTPVEGQEVEEIAEGTPVKVSGWGLMSNGASAYKLQTTDKLKVLSSPNCEYEAGYGYASVICLSHAENEGICRGDYGTGVVSNNKLIGVASFAFGNCGTKYPDIASKMSYYADWINSIMA